MASELPKRGRVNDTGLFTVQSIAACGLNPGEIYTSCAWIPGTTLVIVGTRDGFVIVIDMATKSVHKVLDSGIDRSVNGCVVSRTAEFFVTNFSNGEVMVWDAKNLGVHFTLQKRIPWPGVSCCTISPDGTVIVIGSSNGNLTIWDVAVDRTASEPVTCGVRGLINNTGSECPIYDCTVSPSTEFIVSASADNTLKVWDAAPPFANRATLQGHTSSVVHCAVCPNERFIISMALDETWRVWDTETWELYRETQVDHFCLGLYASPKEGFVVSSGIGPGEFVIWDFEDDTVHTPSDVTEVEGSMLDVSSTYVAKFDERTVTLVDLSVLRPHRRKRSKVLRK